MEERYSGIRFSIRGNGGLQDADLHLKEKIQQKADELFCFGWVQDSKTDIVGEARCYKELGHKLKLYLVQGLKSEIAASSNANASLTNSAHTPIATLSPLIRETDILSYADTKIKLHFSHFKILDEERITCFRDHPHQCEDLTIPMW